MAKKHFGKLLTLAAIFGAAAAGVSYVLQYKSFHKELDEDFHDFEDDFDDFDDSDEGNNYDNSESGTSERSYVSLNPEKKESAPEMTSDTESESAKEESAEEESAESASPDDALNESTTVTVEEITE